MNRSNRSLNLFHPFHSACILGILLLACLAGQSSAQTGQATISGTVTDASGAIIPGATAALIKRMSEGGSWHVTVSLTRTAMWCGSLGLVDPALACSRDQNKLAEPDPYDAPSPLGDVHMLAPPVGFSNTPPRWADPILVPRGSSRAEWRT